MSSPIIHSGGYYCKGGLVLMDRTGIVSRVVKEKNGFESATYYLLDHSNNIYTINFLNEVPKLFFVLDSITLKNNKYSASNVHSDHSDNFDHYINCISISSDAETLLISYSTKICVINIDTKEIIQTIDISNHLKKPNTENDHYMVRYIKEGRHGQLIINFQIKSGNWCCYFYQHIIMVIDRDTGTRRLLIKLDAIPDYYNNLLLSNYYVEVEYIDNQEGEFLAITRKNPYRVQPADGNHNRKYLYSYVSGKVVE